MILVELICRRLFIVGQRFLVWQIIEARATHAPGGGGGQPSARRWPPSGRRHSNPRRRRDARAIPSAIRLLIMWIIFGPNYSPNYILEYQDEKDELAAGEGGSLGLKWQPAGNLHDKSIRATNRPRCFYWRRRRRPIETHNAPGASEEYSIVFASSCQSVMIIIIRRRR